MKNIFIFENEGTEKLLPLTYLRKIGDLRVGIFTMRERIEKTFRTTEFSKESPLFINGRTIRWNVDEIQRLKNGEMLISKDQILAFRFGIKSKKISMEQIRNSCKEIECNGEVIEYPWNLIEINKEILNEDFVLAKRGIYGFVDDGARIYGDKKNLHIGRGSKSDAFSVLNLETGPIYIGKNVHITPFSIIEGPAYIGDGTIVDGGKIRGGTTIGPVCRISGEVENCIFQGYSNKHHEGFLGHSWVGEWVNLGAGTTNSDLKNNYKEVKVHIQGKEINTKSIKVGCFIGDHTKTGIGTLINTGTVIDIFCNILGGRLTPKYIPPFLWDSGDGFSEYKIERAIETAKVVMKRRGKTLSKKYEKKIKKVFEITRRGRI